jgi:hypothetical protein
LWQAYLLETTLVDGHTSILLLAPNLVQQWTAGQALFVLAAQKNSRLIVPSGVTRQTVLVRPDVF